MIRYILAALIGLALIGLAFIPAHAEPQERNCLTIAGIEAQAKGLARGENVIHGEAAQKLSDALSERFHSERMTVTMVVAFFGAPSIALVYGFDPDGCAVIAGHMTLDIYNAARQAAGLPPVAVRVEPTKAI